MTISAIKYSFPTYLCTQHSCHESKSLVERKKKSINVYERGTREITGEYGQSTLHRGYRDCSIGQRPCFSSRGYKLDSQHSCDNSQPSVTQVKRFWCSFLVSVDTSHMFQTTRTNKIINTLHTYNFCIKLMY